MELQGPGKRLRVYIGSNDRYQRKTMYEAIIDKAKELGLAGCTIVQGLQGFGAASHVIHRARILRLSEELPLIIEMVDTEEHIHQAIEAIEDMVDVGGKGVLMTLEPVDIIRYSKGTSVSS